MWHLWTLSVEEWFYAVIAGTVLICVKKHWIKQLGVLMGVFFVAIGIARWYAYTGFYQDDVTMISGVRMALLQRPDALMLGVGMATFNAYLTEERLLRWRKLFLFLGTVALVVWFANLADRMLTTCPLGQRSSLGLRCLRPCTGSALATLLGRWPLR